MPELGHRSCFLVVVVLSALVLIGPIRKGDLPGYDDASFAYMAKDILRGTNWIQIRNEHPPLVPLIQASLFFVFGLSDFLAKLPSALAGFGCILLVYWLGRRLYGRWYGLLAMLILAATAYFVKYAARAMTDVPFTFFFLGAICAWVAAEENPTWYLATAACTGLAEMTRGLMWVALPLIFIVHGRLTRRRLPAFYLMTALFIALLPIGLWYSYLIGMYGREFLSRHVYWLNAEVYGPLDPAWRRYTGAFEYASMLAKSYWPWLPFTAIGLVTVIRRRDSGYLLTIWAAVVFILCAAARSRILRYMLPAYPAFAILASLGLRTVFTEAQIRRALTFVLPLLAIGVSTIAIFPPAHYHATEIRPIAVAATAATTMNEQLGVYDSGEPRWDEASQLQWYGDRLATVLLSHEELENWVHQQKARVFVIDRNTYNRDFAAGVAHRVLLQGDRLVCIRLEGSSSFAPTHQ